jgi:hypothetical protein
MVTRYGGYLGNNRRRGDTAPADRCARMPAIDVVGVRSSSKFFHHVREGWCR